MASNILVEKLFEARTLREIFEDYLNESEDRLKGSVDPIEVLQRINGLRAIVFEKLNKLKKEILDLDISEDSKGELLNELIKIEYEINMKFMEFVGKYKDSSEKMKIFKDIIDKSPKYAVFLRNCIRRKNLLDCLAEIAEKEGLKGISQYIKKYGELIPKTKKEVRSITPDNAVKILSELAELFEYISKEVEKVDFLKIMSEVEEELEQYRKMKLKR